jgi:hypothetical protein
LQRRLREASGPISPSRVAELTQAMYEGSFTLLSDHPHTQIGCADGTRDRDGEAMLMLRRRFEERRCVESDVDLFELGGELACTQNGCAGGTRERDEKASLTLPDDPQRCRILLPMGNEQRTAYELLY